MKTWNIQYLNGNPHDGYLVIKLSNYIPREVYKYIEGIKTEEHRFNEHG